ncbi:MAG: hypothetical protein J6L72_07065 [Butyricicoccus sp.]|nr:hypothetical protein [Butyricicoccus sp.]
MKNKDTPIGRVHFVREEVSLDRFVRGIFGFGLEKLIEEIRENPGGKYDALYQSGKEGTV